MAGHRTPGQAHPVWTSRNYSLTPSLSYKYFSKCLIKCKKVKSFHWKLLQWSIKALQNTQDSRVKQMPELTDCFSQPNLPPVFRECFAPQHSHGFGSPVLPFLPGSSVARFQTVSGWWLHLFLSAWCNILTMAEKNQRGVTQQNGTSLNCNSWINVLIYLFILAVDNKRPRRSNKFQQRK